MSAPRRPSLLERGAAVEPMPTSMLAAEMAAACPGCGDDNREWCEVCQLVGDVNSVSPPRNESREAREPPPFDPKHPDACDFCRRGMHIGCVGPCDCPCDEATASAPPAPQAGAEPPSAEEMARDDGPGAGFYSRDSAERLFADGVRTERARAAAAPPQAPVPPPAALDLAGIRERVEAVLAARRGRGSEAEIASAEHRSQVDVPALLAALTERDGEIAKRVARAIEQTDLAGERRAFADLCRRECEQQREAATEARAEIARLRREAEVEAIATRETLAHADANRREARETEERLTADLAASERVADRLRHGQDIEGDHVCPGDVRADKAEMEIKRLRAVFGRLAELARDAARASHFAMYDPTSIADAIEASLLDGVSPTTEADVIAGGPTEPEQPCARALHGRS